MNSLFALQQPLVSAVSTTAPAVTSEPASQGSSFINDTIGGVFDLGKTWLNGVLQADAFKRISSATSGLQATTNQTSQTAATTSTTQSKELIAGVPNTVTYSGLGIVALVLVVLLFKAGK